MIVYYYYISSIIGSDIAIGWVDDKSGKGELRVCLLRERERERETENFIFQNTPHLYIAIQATILYDTKISTPPFTQYISQSHET